MRCGFDCRPHVGRSPLACSVCTAVLFPPLTHLRPTGNSLEMHKGESGVSLLVLEVEASFG